MLRVIRSGLLAAALMMVLAATASARSFNVYSGKKPLAQFAPGAVLKSRTISLHFVGVPLPVKVVQLLYRSTGALGQPTANVTSVLEPVVKTKRVKVVSYESAYDSLNPADEPSAQIYGHATVGAGLWDGEQLLVTPLLLDGVTVVVPDTEGQKADFAAGPVYGMNTLDSLRAAFKSSATGIPSAARVALMGYSGGAIGADWAAQMAPKYAPAVNRRLVGDAEGGVLVDPAHNIQYVDGSGLWAGIAPMAITGLARAYHINLKPYMSAYGTQVVADMQKASILNVYGQYPLLKFSQLVKPQYSNPFSIAPFVKVVNELNLGHQPMPTIPMFIGQGAGGYEELTPPGGAGIGAGDGVMVTGDVRSLAREFCAAGDAVDYQQYDLLSHIPGLATWAPEALTWALNRLQGGKPANNCSTIPAGNSLAFQRLVK
jgi:Secretory lipase